MQCKFNNMYINLVGSWGRDKFVYVKLSVTVTTKNFHSDAAIIVAGAYRIIFSTPDSNCKQSEKDIYNYIPIPLKYLK